MFITPMLLEEREEPFDDDRYIFEPKIDGHRMILSLIDGKVQMYTRHHNNCTRQYPELFNVPVKPDCDVVLDGEVGYMNPETGRFEFEHLMERFKQSKEPKIREGRLRLPVRYFVFDVLFAGGEDVRSWPLVERKALLEEILTENEFYKKVMRINRDGSALFDVIKSLSLEGIVAKRKDSRYVSGPSDGWLKVMNYQYENVPIIGYRKKHFALLAQINDGTPGRIELSLPAVLRREFHRAANEIQTGEDRHFVYIQPQIQARLRYRNRNHNGMLRLPEFVDFVV
ncbi:ATP-dependent DNA ligase [Paenibacillus mendelii]|uniref:RNA ligase family protein n=1 Tax=Paenibacillus mendelii TaxID=206163 RepID=A0ABV6J947_9BACL|nr:RNA ligase family protein [Paenibacillus mendelii]MCQ6559739.1 ATP-dependent DNA ligase [Paenibacillus mendelii]